MQFRRYVPADRDAVLPLGRSARRPAVWRAARLILVPVAMVLLGLVSAPAALAAAAAPAARATPITATGPYNVGGGTISVLHPPPGSGCTVTGNGFGPDSTVQVQILSTPMNLTSVTADANGQATASITIPTEFLPASHHTIELVGVDSSNTAMIVSIPVILGSVSAAPTRSMSTGTAVLLSLLVASAVFVVGAAVIVATRNRRMRED